MGSKSIKPKPGRGRPKRVREVEISVEEIDENQNPKKNKSEVCEEQDKEFKMFEKQFDETINIGIELYHNRMSSKISNEEKLAYMSILKKISTSTGWRFKNVISNKEQIDCLAHRTIESRKEQEEMLKRMKEFIEYKLKGFQRNAESLANHYKSELKCKGVTMDELGTKIKDLETKKIELKNEKNKKKIIEVLPITRKVCRLCGSKRNLKYSIDQKEENKSFKEIIEFYCRIEIQENANLPHLVCTTCRGSIDNFAKFSKRVVEFQNDLLLNIGSYAETEMESFVEPEETIIKTEIVDLDYHDDSSLSTRSQTEIINDNESSYDEYLPDVAANYICSSDGHFITTNSRRLTETRDIIIPQMESEIIHNTSENNDAECEEEDVRDNSNNNVISCSEVSTSTPKTPTPPRRISNVHPKELKIILERLPIKYVPSDGEESQEELEEESEIVGSKSKKRKTRSLNKRRKSCLEINYQSVRGSISNLTELVS